MLLDHVAMEVPASKFEELVAFLVAALGYAGFKEHRRPMPGLVGLGTERDWLWFHADSSGTSEQALQESVRRSHFGFTAESREEVRSFYEAAIKAGGQDNGAPGPRPHFGTHYYAAFVRDPACGINFEVVCRKPE